MAKIVIETNFVKADVNIRKGDIVKLKDEGHQTPIKGFDGEMRNVWQFTLELPNGETKIYTMNVSTQKVLIQAWGDETKNWIDKPLEALVEKKIIKGQVVKSLSLIPAEGVKAIDNDDIPIVEDSEEAIPVEYDEN